MKKSLVQLMAGIRNSIVHRSKNPEGAPKIVVFSQWDESSVQFPNRNEISGSFSHQGGFLTDFSSDGVPSPP